MSGFLDEVTPVIIARDEEANIGRTLAQLAWARQVIVVDSLSTDATPHIAQTFPYVRLLQRPFDDLARQWTFAAAEARTEWVLTLDADYFVPEAFARELSSLDPRADVAGYAASFVYAIRGKPLRASLYPPRIVLLRRGHHEFYMDGHTQRVRVRGEIRTLREPLVHDDRKPLRRFVERQRRYMRDEAAKIRTADIRSLDRVSRIRRLRVVAPLAALFHTLFVKMLILEGPKGWYYAFERTLAEVILSLELMKRERSSDLPSPGGPSSS